VLDTLQDFRRRFDGNENAQLLVQETLERLKKEFEAFKKAMSNMERRIARLEAEKA
jgi:predicted  nucleic acid-binding Zn-ribbon protein